MKRFVYVAHALGLVLPLSHVTVAFAQQGGAAPGGGADPSGQGAPASGGGAQAGAGGGTTTTTVTTGPTTYQYNPLGSGVAPVAPGGTLGGGNTQFSSSKPITGNERDSFDFQRGGSGGTLRGGENSSFIIDGSGGSGGGTRSLLPPPASHVVRKGDTLWGICDFYFQNPYQWPRIWSYNPQIQNPHWIYPGEQVKLRGGAGMLGEAAAAPQASGPQAGGGIVDRRRQVPPDTVFLRSQGYIDDDTHNWGEINGAAEDKLILTDFDEVYVRVGKDHDVKLGQELTVFRPVRKVGSGQVIEIQGTVKVDQWNAKERIARARITESLDAIERGARVGPIQRRFEVVPPARNDKDVEATVVSSVQSHNFYGQNQVVFIDKGEEAGLKPGNRLFIVRKGDAWHRTQPTRAAARRIALEDESPAATETVPRPRDEKALPEEVIAELRVINMRKNTAMCIVTSSRREIDPGDKAVARSGY
jgi:hypothetical protein